MQTQNQSQQAEVKKSLTKRQLIFFVSIIVVCVITAGVLLWVQRSSYEDKIDSKKDDIENLEKDIDELNDKIEQIEKDKQSLEDEQDEPESTDLIQSTTGTTSNEYAGWNTCEYTTDDYATSGVKGFKYKCPSEWDKKDVQKDGNKTTVNFYKQITEQADYLLHDKEGIITTMGDFEGGKGMNTASYCQSLVDSSNWEIKDSNVSIGSYTACKLILPQSDAPPKYAMMVDKGTHGFVFEFAVYTSDAEAEKVFKSFEVIE